MTIPFGYPFGKKAYRSESAEYSSMVERELVAYSRKLPPEEAVVNCIV
jgi:hypothetical protein